VLVNKNHLLWEMVSCNRMSFKQREEKKTAITKGNKQGVGVEGLGPASLVGGGVGGCGGATQG